jgi:hypothetical protein
MRAAIIILAAMLAATPAVAGTITCTTVNTVRSCRGPNGYTSTEVMSNGMVFGRDSDGRKWTETHSNTLDFLKVAPPPDDR